MSQIRLVTDSGADIPKAEAERLGISVVPLVVNFGDETYFDGEMDVDTFWEKAQTVHPKSSQPSVGAFEQAFAPLVEAGAEVLCVTITSKHSGTYNSAWAAAQRFGDKVTVFDSQSLSWGQAFQVLAAVRAASEGKAMRDILSILEDIRERTRVFILLNTIEFLERGGRAARFISVVKKVVSFFNIKPILTLDEGELKLLGTANSFKRGLLRIERELKALVPLERLGILHTRSQELAEKFAQDMAEKLPFPLSAIQVAETRAALSTHAGPGVIAAVALPTAR